MGTQTRGKNHQSMRVSTPAPIELASDCSTTVARPGSAVGSVRDDQAGGIDDDEVGLAPTDPPNREEGNDEEAAPSAQNAVAILCGPPIVVKLTLPVLETLGFASGIEGVDQFDRAGRAQRRIIEGKPGRWAQAFGNRLGVTLGGTTLKTFANGEIYARFEESVRGADVFLVQSCVNPVNRNLIAAQDGIRNFHRWSIDPWSLQFFSQKTEKVVIFGLITLSSNEKSNAKGRI